MYLDVQIKVSIPPADKISSVYKTPPRKIQLCIKHHQEVKNYCA